MTTTFKIIKFVRAGSLGEEVFEFKAGLNLIVGEPNTGKSQLLAMIDFVLGAPGNPNESFSVDLVGKYESAKLEIAYDSTHISVERRWKEPGKRSKVLVNGHWVDAKDFSKTLLSQVGYPILNFPQGNPYSGRPWPHLSWRMMLRHIYRSDRHWSGIAPKQPPSETSAVVLYFFGAAPQLFSQERGKLVSLQNRHAELKARKMNFMSTLQDVWRRVSAQNTSSKDLNLVALENQQEKLKVELSRLEEAEKNLTSDANRLLEADDEYYSLKSQLDELRAEWELADRDYLKLKARATELVQYIDRVDQEKLKLERTRIAGDVLADLKVTHCPVCDQPVELKQRDPCCCVSAVSPYRFFLDS